MQSTPLIAFDQHAARTVAAVLLPGQQTPALQRSPPIVRRFSGLSDGCSATGRWRAATRPGRVASSGNGPWSGRASRVT